MELKTSETWTSEELRHVALKVGEAVATFLREYREKNISMELVKGETFKADVMAESIAIDEVLNHGIKGLIVTEEKGVFQLGNDNIITIIDPLDGTINYVSNIPWCAVSIAFAFRTKNPSLDDVVAGAIWPVFYGEPISFATGTGLFHGNKKTGRDSILKNYNEIGWKMLAVYEDDPQAIDSIKKIYNNLTAKLRKNDKNISLKIRSLGSAAMELGFVALGKIGYFVDLRARLRIVDVAAGLGAIREASGFYIDSKGKPVNLRTDRISRLESIIAVTMKNDAKVILNALR